jgi:hypothetical protein
MILNVDWVLGFEKVRYFIFGLVGDGVAGRLSSAEDDRCFLVADVWFGKVN